MANETDKNTGLSLSTMKKDFEHYASAKEREIAEWVEATRYYSGDQYTDEQLRELKKRSQPAIVFNLISRKIDGIVGTVRRLRTDPKAFPKKPADDQAAELATHVIRYVCDAAEFESIEADACLSAAVFGFAGLELGLRETQDGDQEIELLPVDSRTFYYDPRSFRWDFSDARWMGVSKWVTRDEVDEIAPEAADQGSDGSAFETQGDFARDDKWRDDAGRLRLVDHWYIKGGIWRWCLHIGNRKIAEGDSPFFDDEGRSLCKYRMFSAYIDHEGDRYGMVRVLKGPQDATNQHRSKSVWIMNTRQIKVRRGEHSDLEKLRREASRPDGVILYDNSPDEIEIIQPAQEFLQQTQYYQDAKTVIENFGPNPALIGTGIQAKSGRALTMLQQSALAELGPFLKNFRVWKLDIYKAIWSNTKRYTTAQKIWRITGDEEAAQFVELNKLELDEFGQSSIVNAIGKINVDIRIEEGPDTETVTGDAFDALQALAQNGVPVPPQAIVEMSALPKTAKEKVLRLLQPQPDPAAQAAQQIKMAQEEGKARKDHAAADKTESEAALNRQQLGMNELALSSPVYTDPFGGF